MAPLQFGFRRILGCGQADTSASSTGIYQNVPGSRSAVPGNCSDGWWALSFGSTGPLVGLPNIKAPLNCSGWAQLLAGGLSHEDCCAKDLLLASQTSSSLYSCCCWRVGSLRRVYRTLDWPSKHQATSQPFLTGATVGLRAFRKVYRTFGWPPKLLSSGFSQEGLRDPWFSSQTSSSLSAVLDGGSC